MKLRIKNYFNFGLHFRFRFNDGMTKKNGGIFNVYLAASITNLSNTRANIEILTKLHLSVATSAFERKISP